MKVTVLSLKQPWAELIAAGKKTVELRSWNTNFRGTVYIHASRNTDKKKCKEIGIKPDDLTTGAVIGSAELVDVIIYNTREELAKDAGKHFASEYKIPCYGFILKNLKRVKPIPCSGKLGLWKLSTSLVQ